MATIVAAKVPDCKGFRAFRQGDAMWFMRMSTITCTPGVIRFLKGGVSKGRGVTGEP